jgi:hypothetical protein
MTTTSPRVFATSKCGKYVIVSVDDFKDRLHTIKRSWANGSSNAVEILSCQFPTGSRDLQIRDRWTGAIAGYCCIINKDDLYSANSPEADTAKASAAASDFSLSEVLGEGRAQAFRKENLNNPAMLEKASANWSETLRRKIAESDAIAKAKDRTQVLIQPDFDPYD